jgi:hypothetical protein
LNNVVLSLADYGTTTNFTEADTCGPNGTAAGSMPFSLFTGQSCVITVAFAPTEACTSGSTGNQCLATLSVTSGSSVFTVNIEGQVSNGGSALVTAPYGTNTPITTMSVSDFRMFSGGSWSGNDGKQLELYPAGKMLWTE